MKKETAYVSGKITGLTDLNKPKFLEIEQRLIEKGYEVVNPHKIFDGVTIPSFETPEQEWCWYMRGCLMALMACDIIFLLDDWKQSRGAIWEIKNAMILNIPIYCAHTFKLLDSPLPKDEPITKRVPTKDIISSIGREIGMRKSVYPNLVIRGKMTPVIADHEIKVMQQVLQDYKDLQHLGATTAQPIQKTQSTLFL